MLPLSHLLWLEVCAGLYDPPLAHAGWIGRVRRALRTLAAPRTADRPRPAPSSRP